MYTWDIYAFIPTFVYLCIFTYVVFSHINIVYHPYVFTLLCGLICLDYSARCLIIHVMHLSGLVEHMLGQLSVSVCLQCYFFVKYVVGKRLSLMP